MLLFCLKQEYGINTILGILNYINFDTDKIFVEMGCNRWNMMCHATIASYFYV